MGNKITNIEEVFPHIYIQEAKDNTLRSEAVEAGAMCGIGYLAYGNPLYPVSIGYTSEKSKSIKTVKGGNPKNETIYHIKDYLSEFNGRVNIARLLGVETTTKTLSVIGTDTKSIDASNVINIFGATGLSGFSESTPTAAIEIALNFCPQNSVTVTVKNEDDYLTVTVEDAYKVELFKAIGHSSSDHENDYGVNDYIGNIADPKAVTIKVDTSHTDYSSDFSVSQTFTNGLVEDKGTISVEKAESILMAVAHKSDYVGSFGITDTALLKMLKRVSDEANITLSVDIKADTLQQAIDFKTALAFSDKDTWWCWSRMPYRYPVGVQNIGVSGWFIGRNVARNVDGKHKRAEFRIDGVAGKYHPIPRIAPYDLVPLTRDEKILLTKNRINTIEDIEGQICLTDVLSGHEKNTDLMSFPSNDGLLYIERYIARLLESQVFKNLSIASSYMDTEAKPFFADCQQNKFFSDTFNYENNTKMYIEGSDKLVFTFECSIEGVMRKGRVESTINKREV